MSAAAVKLYTFTTADGRVIYSSTALEPIFKTASVSADGNDNGLTISESAGKFDMNAKVVGNIAPGTAAGQALSYTQRGAANGVASLDGGSKVPAAQLPNSVVETKGTWNALTNSPSLANGTGNAGDVYRVNVAANDVNLGAWFLTAGASVINGAAVVTVTETNHGLTTGMKATITTATAIGGISAANLSRTATAITVIDADTFSYVAGANATSTTTSTLDEIDILQNFVVGDWIIYGTGFNVWYQAHAGADLVASVNGFAGVVVLTTTNIAEGTNLYYTSARFNTAFAAKSTDDLTEGSTNLYYTTARFDTRFATKTTDNLTEGSTNLYFTTTRARTAAVVNSLAGSQTDQAPSVSAVNAALAVSATYENFTNKQGATVSALQFTFQSVFGEMKLIDPALVAITEDTLFAVVKDATIANNATGAYYTPGATITGFPGASFTVGLPVYPSKTVPGGFQQDLTGYVSGDRIVRLGIARTATSLRFNPQYDAVLG